MADPLSPIEQTVATFAGEAPKAAETPEVPEAAPSSPPQSKQFSLLAKKERQLFREREALKAEKQAFEAAKARITELEEKFAKKPSSPREALERFGYSYRDATDFELNDGAPTAEQIARATQAEIQQLREEQAQKERHAAEQAARQAELEKAEVEAEFRTEIREYTKSKPDDYEFIEFHSAHDVVYSVVEEHYQKTGRLLSIPEAANMVEKFLEGQAAKLQQTKKFAKSRPGDPQPPSGNSRQPEVPAPKRTLDNNATASTPTLVKSSRVEDERIRRALNALGG